ncbi:MAG: PIG-L family deacetylase [Anaerolineales bacterium]|nr:PIG-L family deacetylase [Anaerolineales bacterium]
MDLNRIDPCVPIVRPHYRLEGNHLYFLISRRPSAELSEKEMRIFRTIDGGKNVSEIARGEKDAEQSLRKWFDEDILELVPPIVPPASPHLVVIEPHMDDAMLSVGGRLLQRRGKNRITILSVVKYSNFTSYWDLKRDYLDVAAVTKLRLGESALAARMIGAEHRSLDWTDAPIRFFPGDRWRVDDLKRILPTIFAYMEISPDPADIAVLQRNLVKALEELAPDEIWIPMGLGSHVDHRTVRSACIGALAPGGSRFPNASVQIYEDLPYNKASHAKQIENTLENQGGVLTRCTEDVTDVFDEKLRVISVFASQFKRAFIDPLIRTCAEKASQVVPGRLSETYYRVDCRPALPRESSMAPNRDVLEAGRRRVRSLAQKPAMHQMVVILATPSANPGRWRTDCDRLLSRFPDARIRLVIPKDMSWQFSFPVNERIRIIALRSGLAGWIRETLKALLLSRTILIFLWWGAGRMHRGWKGAVLEGVASSFRKAFITQSLGDICLLLEEEGGEDGGVLSP